MMKEDTSTVTNKFEEPEEDSLPDIEREFKKYRKSSVCSLKEESLNFFNKKYLKKVSAKPAKPRRCGLCNKVGHNRRVCDFRSFIDEVIFLSFILYLELEIVNKMSSPYLSRVIALGVLGR